MLNEKILNIIKYYCTYGSIVVYDLNKNKNIVAINDKNKIQSASTIKLIIAIHALKKVLNNDITLDYMIDVNQNDCVEFSIIKNLSIRKFKLKDLLTLMITLSDNTAANALIEFFTYDEINKTIEELGLTDTVLKRKMMDFKAAESGYDNMTTARDMASVLVKLYRHEILDSYLCSFLFNIMSVIKDNDPIRKYIGESVYIANKPGELNCLNCDVGLYKTNKVTYIISMFVTGKDNNSTKECLSQISKSVYEYYINENERTKAVVTKNIAPLTLYPDDKSEISDELMCGFVVDIMDNLKNGWYKIVTHYGYYGFIKDCFLKSVDDYTFDSIITHPAADMTYEPKYESPIMDCLFMGTMVKNLNEVQDRWVKVRLIDGRTGWIRKEFVKKYDILNKKANLHLEKKYNFEDNYTYMSVSDEIETKLRDNIVSTALKFLNAQYRWGGKSYMGIDCSGLTSLAYFVSGIMIPRDADLQQYFLINVQRDQLKEGDLIFFPGHVALYLGNDKYIHSTGREGKVVINSLNKNEIDYREDLNKNLSGCGTVFIKQA